MKFARTDLIDRVKTEIARREQDATDRTARDEAEHQKQLAAHLAATGPAWKQLADTIRTRQRNNKPIVLDDIPAELRNGSSSAYVTVWNRSAPKPATADVTALWTLLRLLEAATDEEITAAGIERLGFRTAELFRTR